MSQIFIPCESRLVEKIYCYLIDAGLLEHKKSKQYSIPSSMFIVSVNPNGNDGVTLVVDTPNKPDGEGERYSKIIKDLFSIINPPYVKNSVGSMVYDFKKPNFVDDLVNNELS
jgi:hypothetical protein